MALLNTELVEKLSILESSLSGIQKSTIKQYLSLCNDEINGIIKGNKSKYKIPYGKAVIYVLNDTKHANLFTDIFKEENLELGIRFFNSHLNTIVRGTNSGSSFTFDEQNYKIIRKSRDVVIQPRTVKIDVRKKIKKKSKQTKTSVYKETKEERRERILNYLNPVYSPMGLGKRR
jgi:virulence-associated protein VagC